MVYWNENKHFVNHLYKWQHPFFPFALLMIQRSCGNGMVVISGDLIFSSHPKHLVTLGGQKFNGATVKKVAGGSGYGGLCRLQFVVWDGFW